MKMLVTKMALAASVALATLIAAEAASAQGQQPVAPEALYRTSCPPGFVVDSEASGEIDSAGPCVRVQPDDDVIIGGHEFGRDPDPFIRDQLRREHELGYPN